MSLVYACVLTVLIETPFLRLFGYRGREDTVIIVCANVVTNLILNLSFQLFLPYRVPVILAAELLVVAAEYGIYAAAFGRSRRLLLLTFAANALSFGLGELLNLLLRAVA